MASINHLSEFNKNDCFCPFINNNLYEHCSYSVLSQISFLAHCIFIMFSFSFFFFFLVSVWGKFTHSDCFSTISTDSTIFKNYISSFKKYF